MSNYGNFPLPQHLDHLRDVRTEYEDVNGTGACMLELGDDESTCRTWLDFREMRQFAMHLMNLADQAEHEFLKAHGLHDL